MEPSVKKQIGFLFAYSVFITFVLGIFIVYFFANQKKSTVGELTVKKINIVDDKGRLNMVISNSRLQHPGRMNGKDLEPRKRPAGIIFFNEEGDECGGLVYDGATKNGVMNTGMSFTMDQYHQDQAVQLMNEEELNNGSYSVKRGLAINDYAPGSNLMEDYKQFIAIKGIKNDAVRKIKLDEYKLNHGARKRVFIGRNRENNTGLFLADNMGNIKLKIYVDSLGEPRFEMVKNHEKIEKL